LKSGFVSVETHADHLDLIRILLSEEQPDLAPTPDADRSIRYCARFYDSEAGLMHTHEILKRRLVDINTHLYRVPPEQAIAAIESVDLKHRRIYLDPDLDGRARAEAARLAEKYRRRRRRKDAVFRILGYLALALLLFNLFVVSL
jgi:hypothetical protein